VRERWSHSKLTALFRCGEAFRREEIEREFAPSSSAAVRGTVVHAIAAHAHGEQLKAKALHPDWPKPMVLRESLPGEEEAADLAATRFETERKRGIVAPADEVQANDPPNKIIGRDKDSAIRMARYLVTRIAPYVDPVAVEQKVVVEPADSNIRISGIMDLVTNEQRPGDETPRRGIRDYKTSRKPPNPNEAHSSGQLSMYALLDLLQRGSIADVFALDYLVEDPRRYVGAPYLTTLESTRTQEDIDVMVARLNNAIEGVKAGVFLANGVGTWYCSPKWCRFWTTCRFVSRADR
jgi:RecB family exonuclease